MVEAARSLGYSYFAVTDHSASHGFGDHVTPGMLEERIEEIAELNERIASKRFRVLAGSEVNILTDGSLDYEDSLLERLDWVVASVHTSFRMTKENMTKRMVAAVEHPLVDCLGPSLRPHAAPARGLRLRRRSRCRGRGKRRDDDRDQRQPEPP